VDKTGRLLRGLTEGGNAVVKRRLLSRDRPCPFRCLYCFAEFPEYTSRELFVAYPRIDDDTEILYPSCDGEFLLQRDPLGAIRTVYENSDRFCIVTFSTKAPVGERLVEQLAVLNAHLFASGRGFIKLSVSITNKSRIAELEPGTASYRDRLLTLERLSIYDLPRSVTLKPLLPFISLNEYKEIVEETRQYTDSYLLGDLYVSTRSPFYANYIDGKYLVEQRSVEWLDEQPCWSVIRAPELQHGIEACISRLGAYAFDCDTGVVQHFIQKNDLRPSRSPNSELQLVK
jgi:hypothetical protein